MNDRGEYRSLFVAFADDADVHALSGDAFKLLIMLKLTLPVTGIGVVYLSKLCDQVGCDRARLEGLMGELEAAKPGSDYGWIRRERNVVWIVNALRFEPNLAPANAKKHRPYIQRLAAQLDARMTIVAAFRAHYPEWFDTVSDGKSNRTDRVSKQKQCTNSAQEKTSSELPQPIAGAADAPPRPERENWVASLTETWRKEVGHVELGHLGKKLKPYVAKHGVETVRQAMELYAVERKAMQKPGKFAWFLDDIATWIDGATDPMVIDGVLTPFAERMSRAAAKNGAHA